MERTPSPRWRAAAMVADTLVLTATWMVVVGVRAGLHTTALPPLPAEVVLPLGWLVVPLWVGVLGLRGAYRGQRRQLPGTGLWRTAVAVGQALLAVLLLLFLFQVDVNRTLLLGFAAASWPALVARRALQRRFDPVRVVVIGSADERVPLRRALTARGIQVVGEQTADASPALGHRLDQGHIDEVFVAGTLPADRLVELARLCDGRGIPLSLDATFVGIHTSQADLLDLEGWTAITLGAPAHVDLERLAKRALDVVGAAVALVLAGPVIAVLAAAIRIADGGPAFFIQERVGHHGRPFRMWKLRTMVPDAEARLSEVEPHNEVTGAAFKMADDPRVTRLGSWLRRRSLDELPQLVNVLQGDMSLVGPRPPLAREVEAYDQRHLRRLSVRPGMTGLWQVSGRSDLPFERWMALDLQYVDEWSLWLDIRLLARTLPAVITGVGAR